MRVEDSAGKRKAVVASMRNAADEVHISVTSDAFTVALQQVAFK